MRKRTSTKPRSTDFPVPPVECRTWSAHKKTAVVLAVRSGALSRADAYDRYMLSEEELAFWEMAFEQDGIAGLQLGRASSARSA